MNPLAPALLAAALGLASPGGAAELAPPTGAPAEPAPDAGEQAAQAHATRYRLEVKVATTNRASPDETSRTTLRAEARPGDGPLAYLRLATRPTSGSVTSR